MLGSFIIKTLFISSNISLIVEHTTTAFYGSPKECEDRKSCALHEWENFKRMHGKKYDDPREDNVRRAIFRANQRFCYFNNLKFKKGLTSFTVGINSRSDKHDQPKSLSNIRIGHVTNKQIAAAAIYGAPDKIDWREKNRVTEVRDQMNCDSSWAFAATGALEAYHAYFNGTLLQLSPQNLIDCDIDDGGCNGGFAFLGFVYVNKSGGLDTEASYPYEGRLGKCRFSRSNIGASLKEYEFILANEKDLKEAVGTRGPAVALIDASLKSFRHYKSGQQIDLGVYDDPKCRLGNDGQWILIVGYGRDESFGDYWLIKNSWGRSWGEDGYMRLARNRGNLCGISSVAAQPKYN